MTSATANTLTDAGERRRALEPAGSFIVQAPAGSGKTEILIQRVLALLGTVRRPEEILAITFTRKAAAEMRGRLLRALEAGETPEPQKPHEKMTWQLARRALAADRRFGWDLRDNPARLQVQTIDGFCAALTRRMPWLSRFGAQATVSENATPLYRAAADRVLAQAEADGEGGATVRTLLAHLDNRLDLLGDLLAAMLARRDQWLRHLAGAPGEDPRAVLEDALRSLVEETLSRACSAVPPSLQEDLIALGAFAAANLSADGQENEITRLADPAPFPGSAAEDLSRWRGIAGLLLTGGGTLRKAVDKRCGFPAHKSEPFRSMKERMVQILTLLEQDKEIVPLLSAIRGLPETSYSKEQWEVVQALIAVLLRGVGELWLVFREEGATDFVEIALAANQALGQPQAPTDLLLHLDSRINHILVDEFQDTSYGQYLLLEKLTAGWTEGDGRTLFVVGDPMQSIYRFREAEVGLYLRARRQGIGEVRLTPLTLRANFRSQAGLVQWVGTAFAGAFPAVEDPACGAVAFSPSEAVHPHLPGDAVTITPFAERDDAGEAEKVVALVRQAQNDHPEGTTAVLVRSRGHLARILRAFKGAGLSFRAQEIDRLQDRSITRDLWALTRALLHPADRVAWLAVLRAPWCGLLLADLHALCLGAADRTAPELLHDSRRLERLSEDGRRRVERVVRVLETARERRGRIDLRRLVEGTWLALGGPACVQEGEIDDAEIVFSLLEEIDCGGELTPLESFADALSSLYAAPDTRAGEALQVMTVHKSKGLEFDTVILPGLGRPPRPKDKALLRWVEHPDHGLLLAPIPPRDGRTRDAIYEAVGRLEKEKESLEVTRLFYVAATRAKKRLHLLGHVPPRSSDPAPGSLLEKLWPTLNERFRDPGGEENGPDDEKDTFPPTPIRRLPAGWTLPSFPHLLREKPRAAVRPSSAEDSEGTKLLYSPETDEGRCVGTVVHWLLERMARDGLEAWHESRLNAERDAIAHRLGRLGIPRHRLAATLKKVVRAATHGLTSERGRWILAPHRGASCELALSGVVNGALVHAVVDRTFIDEKGVRWVVDYKTSEPDDDLESFLTREVDQYREQLLSYVELFRLLEPQRLIRAALYFPLVDGWREVALSTPRSGEEGFCSPLGTT